MRIHMIHFLLLCDTIHFMFEQEQKPEQVRRYTIERPLFLNSELYPFVAAPSRAVYSVLSVVL